MIVPRFKLAPAWRIIPKQHWQQLSCSSKTRDGRGLEDILDRRQLGSKWLTTEKLWVYGPEKRENCAAQELKSKLRRGSRLKRWNLGSG